MKTLLLILLLSSISYADSYLSGTFNLGKMNTEAKAVNRTQNNDATFAMMQLNYKYYNQGINILVSPYMYYIYSSNPLYCIGTQSQYNKASIFLRSSYISYTYGNQTLGYGILPFSNGINTKYNFDYIKDGDGISILNNFSLQGVFYKYKFRDSILKIVYGKIPNENLAGQYIPSFLRRKTEVFLLDYEFEYRGVKYNFEYSHTYLYFKSKKIASINLVGINFQKDNIEDLDLDIYGSIGVSRYKNGNEKVKYQMLDEYKIPYPMPDIYPEAFSFNSNAYFGSAAFFGIRKNYNIFSKDVYINYEHFHSFGDWYSNNSGNLYNTGKITDSHSIDYSDFLKFGLSLDSKSEIGISLIKVNRDILKFGSPERGDFTFSNHTKEINVIRVIYKLRF